MLTSELKVALPDVLIVVPNMKPLLVIVAAVRAPAALSVPPLARLTLPYRLLATTAPVVVRLLAVIYPLLARFEPVIVPTALIGPLL